MVGGAVASKTMREAALYLTGFKRRDLYDAGIGLTPDLAAERLRLRTDRVIAMTTANPSVSASSGLALSSHPRPVPCPAR